MEAGPLSRRGCLIGWQLAAQGAAALLGAALGALLTRVVSPSHLAEWGWRIPFLIGLLIVPVGLYVRRQLREPPIPEANGRKAGAVFTELFRGHGMAIDPGNPDDHGANGTDLCHRFLHAELFDSGDAYAAQHRIFVIRAIRAAAGRYLAFVRPPGRPVAPSQTTGFARFRMYGNCWSNRPF